jgi:hypothetical protein
MKVSPQQKPIITPFAMGPLNENKNENDMETEYISPRNLIQKWNKGDIMFRGKYSSGVTPKNERKVVKGIKLKNKANK